MLRELLFKINQFEDVYFIFKHKYTPNTIERLRRIIKYHTRTEKKNTIQNPYIDEQLFTPAKFWG